MNGRMTMHGKIRGEMAAAFCFALVWGIGFSQDGGTSRDAEKGGLEWLFDGTDLDRWVNVNCAPGSWFVKDGVMVCTGESHGFIRSDTEYENFILEVEWRHEVEGGNSGIFLLTDAEPEPGAPSPRCIEVQLLDGDHGSVFGIRGATLTPVTNPGIKGKTPMARPTEERCRPAGGWNRYVITSQGGTIEVAVNGKVVTRAKESSQRKGYIGLQSEHSEVHFRNIRIRPLAPAAGVGWKAGVAAAEITPEGPMWMSGYAGRTKPATETESPLRAVALAVESPGGDRALLLSLDLVGIDRATSAVICREVMEEHGLAREQVVLNCSHTHSGPAVGRNLRGLFFLEDPDWKLIDGYTEWLRERVVSVAAEALAGLAPATLEWGEGFSDIAVNRRSNRHDEVVKLRAEGRLKGPSDHSLPILKVSGPGGEVRVIVFGYACHPTKLSGAFDRWCGDYAGFARAEVEKAYPGSVAMFWQGCGGDQTPWPRGGADAETARAVGRELAAAVGKRLGSPMLPVGDTLEMAYRELDLKLGPVAPRPELEAALRGKNPFKARLARVILERSETGEKIRESYRGYPVQTWRFGSGLQWIFLGGEVVVDYSLRFKEKYGSTRTWVAGYCNDVMAYIPSERVLGEGGYEGRTSMVYYDLPAAWAPGIEEAIAGEVRAQLGDPATRKGSKKEPQPNREGAGANGN